jgi:Zn-finger nucleic acid-binding protein
MAELTGGDGQIHACPECSGEFLDGSQLNALLLHSNLPGVDSLGGRESPEGPVGTCPTCQVDMVRIEKRGTDMYYEACGDCGFIFAPLEPPAPTEFEGARKRLVDYFRGFTAKKAGAR